MYTQGFHGWLLPRKGAILQFGITVTRPSRNDVYNAISALDVENITNHLLDPASRSLIAAKMQKEAETFFSSISDESAQELMGLTPEKKQQVSLSVQETDTTDTTDTSKPGSKQTVSEAPEATETANGAQNEAVSDVSVSEANQGTLDAKPALDRNHEATRSTLPTPATYGQARSRRAWLPLESACVKG